MGSCCRGWKGGRGGCWVEGDEEGGGEGSWGLYLYIYKEKRDGDMGISVVFGCCEYMWVGYDGLGMNS